MSNSIARQLLDGSRNIDRMRQEIEEILKMVMGMVKKEDIAVFNPRMRDMPIGVFPFSKDCAWGIHSSGCHLEAYCTVSNGLPVPDDRVYTAVSTREPSPASAIKLEHVQMVHESLETFVRGMAQFFPRIRQVWQPLVTAASAFSS